MGTKQSKNGIANRLHRLNTTIIKIKIQKPRGTFLTEGVPRRGSFRYFPNLFLLDFFFLTVRIIITEHTVSSAASALDTGNQPDIQGTPLPGTSVFYCKAEEPEAQTSTRQIHTGRWDAPEYIPLRPPFPYGRT